MLPLPEKDVGCHKTGFAKTCFECVTQHKCQLWQPLDLVVNQATGQFHTKQWGCAEAHAHTLRINMLGRQETTSANIDHLRHEVAQSNDVGMGSALAGINAQIQRVALRREETAQIAHSEAPKQLTGGH